MRARRLAGPHSLPGGFAPTHTRLARWAVGLAEAAVIVVAAGLTLFGVAFAIDGWDAVEDNWVGALTAATVYAGVLSSLTAFALAVVAKVRHEVWRMLWLPLAVFPVIAVLLVLGEAFWWE